MSFNEQFDRYATWRRDFAVRLKVVVEWMKDQSLLDAAVEEKMHRLELQVRNDKVLVAFVAEFSRGKSELINAIFFAGYGRRIMPASAGRTTMCPTELGYDPGVPPCLRLLPIETRAQLQTLMEWRLVPEKWTRVDLDVNDPVQLAGAMEKVSEICHVTQDEARTLGFWHDNSPEENPVIRADGLVEVPRWRHALINIAHPLLKQGLVILDTPGLNAVGAEPELTVSLIPQAHAVVFILAADTGVTRSDLAIWREHLVMEGDGVKPRLVVLNKIDTLWDALSTPEQIKSQIDRQRAASAEILGLPKSQVIAVSAQKGLVAKVTGDHHLLAASQLLELERALAQGVMSQRQTMLCAAVSDGILELRGQAARTLQIRSRDLTEQRLELQGLRGKNTSVIRQMRSRILEEQNEFDVSGARIQAVRSVHLKLLNEVSQLLGTPTMKSELAELITVLKRSGFKFGVNHAYGRTFSRLRELLKKVNLVNGDIHTMLFAAFRQLNSDFAFSLQAPKEPDLSAYESELTQIERSHLQYLGVRNILKLSQGDFSERLVRTLSTRLRAVFESALTEVELWNKSAGAQLDAQLRERRRTFRRRLEAIERIQAAASGLDDRIDEIHQQEQVLKTLDVRLNQLIQYLMVDGETRHSSQTVPADLQSAGFIGAA